MPALADIVSSFPVIAVRGDRDVMFSAITYDSRQVHHNDIFFAVTGDHVDGHDFIPHAVQTGASIIFCEHFPAVIHPHVTYVRVYSTRKAMSAVAAGLYNHKELIIIGITGTDGKSTTSYIIDQLLSAMGENSGFITTPLIKCGSNPQKNPFRQSTPESLQIHRFLHDMQTNGKKYAVIEATSHGLSERTSRLRDVCFHAAVITNITHEHLDFHGSFEQYRADKMRLFQALDHTAAKQSHPTFGVVNADDTHASFFQAATTQPVYTYSTNAMSANLCATDIHSTDTGVDFVVHWQGKSRAAFLPLIGSFNVDNTLAAALTVARLLQKSPLDVFDAASALLPLPGRMQTIPSVHPFRAVLDYAHTPGAFKRVLPAVRTTTTNRLIVVFGSAGDRDKAKRPLQGSIAARYADIIILTDEDPRTEDSMDILHDIAKGCNANAPALQKEGRLFLIPNRRDAIHHAVHIAQKGDTVLFLGKGHESSIVYADHEETWDDALVITEALQNRT